MFEGEGDKKKKVYPSCPTHRASEDMFAFSLQHES